MLNALGEQQPTPPTSLETTAHSSVVSAALEMRGDAGVLWAGRTTNEDGTVRALQRPTSDPATAPLESLSTRPAVATQAAGCLLLTSE